MKPYTTVPVCRRFVGIDLGLEPVPDAAILLKFRKRINDNKLGEALFAQVVQALQGKGFKVNTGPSWTPPSSTRPAPEYAHSTKNAEKAHDPEMHQIRKG